MNEIEINPVIQNDTETKKQKKKIHPFLRNLLISGGLLTVTFIVLFAWFIFRPDNKTENHNLFNIEMISELTTIECRYHNVAVRDNEGNLLGVGKQYVWFEYDVIVSVGIDVNEVQIQKPTTDGVVKIYLPPAKILDAQPDKSTISKPVCELGAFTKLTADEELQIINEGTQKLKDDAKTQEIIYQAHNSAKDTIEQYVVNMGKLIGEEYIVEWLESPNDKSTETTDQANSATEKPN